jgi:hypothetical protein
MIVNKEHFDKVRTFAKENDCFQSFAEALLYLETYAGGMANGVEVTLTPDFAPNSFAFSIQKNGSFWMNGGVIYRDNTKEWGIHT